MAALRNVKLKITFPMVARMRLAAGMLLFIALQQISQAQDFNNYQLLRTSGPLPEEVLTPSSEKYKSEIAQINRKEVGRNNAKDRSTYALESSFVIDQMLRSGMVLFNDPVGAYLQEIVQKIQQANPEIDQELRIYTLRSTAVNAFATDRGSIFVTLGLVARMESEAQLAFILCHEIAHVRNAHSLDKFLTGEAIAENTERKKALRESAFDRTLVEKNNYSKELEMEADAEGYQLFAKTGYGVGSLIGVYEVLKYSYLPIANTPFPRDFLGTGKILFPPAYWMDSVAAVTGTDEDEDNPQSTHPSLATRKTMLAEAMAGKDEHEGSEYLVSEERFRHLKKVARYELPMLHMEDLEVPEGIYTSYLLMQEDTSRYLQKCLVKGLYIIAKFKDDLLWEQQDYADDLEGEIQQVHYVLQNLDDKEAVVLALRHAWDAHRRYPEDKEFKTMTEDLFAMVSGHVGTLDEFYAVANPFMGKDSVPLTIDSVLAAFAQDSIDYGDNFWRSAFHEDVSDQFFATAFNNGVALQKERDAEATREAGSAKADRFSRFSGRAGKPGKGKRSTIKSLVAVTPFFLKIDERRNYEVQYLDTESGQLNYKDILQASAEAAGLDIKILDYSGLEAQDANVFSDINLLNSWFAEQVNYEDLSLTPGLHQELIDSLANVYQTDYFLWSGVISLREAEERVGLKVVMSVFWWPLLPVFLTDIFVPNYDMLYFSILYNVRNLERSTINYSYFNKRGSTTLLKSHVYDSMLEIRSR